MGREAWEAFWAESLEGRDLGSSRTSGRGLDILGGSLWAGIPAFALPVAATSILEQLANLIDVVIVGRFTGDMGTVNMAAVGSNTPITSLILNLFIGLALGANVVIANAVGRQDHDMARRAAHTSVALAAVGVAITVICEAVSGPLLALMRVDAQVMPEALLFFRIFVLGLPSILLYNFEAAIFRSVGVTKMPLQALALSTALNVVLALVFIPVLGWGVAGSAFATVCSYTTAAAILFVRLLGAEGPIRIEPRLIGVDGAALGRIVRIGAPAGLQTAVFALANMVIQSCINSLGTEAMAASSAAMSLEYVCYNLLNSFSQACTTFVGQNSGAGKVARCRKALGVCLVEDGIVAAAMVGAMLVAGRQVLALFNADPQVVELGYLRVCSIFPAYVFSMVYENVSGYLRVFGISVLPAALTTAGVCGVRFVWIGTVFAATPTFGTLLLVYPVSLGITCLLIVGALVWCHPARGREARQAQ